jgi:hypothetical protein
MLHDDPWVGWIWLTLFPLCYVFLVILFFAGTFSVLFFQDPIGNKFAFSARLYGLSRFSTCLCLYFLYSLCVCLYYCIMVDCLIKNKQTNPLKSFIIISLVVLEIMCSQEIVDTPLLVKRVNRGYPHTPMKPGICECVYTPLNRGYTKYECDHTLINGGYPIILSIGDPF